jgi:hypothetical protein
MHHDVRSIFGFHIAGQSLRFYLLVLVLRQKLVKVQHLKLDFHGKLVIDLSVRALDQEFLVEVLGFDQLGSVL